MTWPEAIVSAIALLTGVLTLGLMSGSITINIGCKKHHDD